MNLAQAFRLSDAPCLALVGAGGKTSALFRLARELPPPVIVTATTHLAAHQLALPQGHRDDVADKHLIVKTPEHLAVLERSKLSGVILLTGPYEGERTRGLSSDILSWLHGFCDSNHIPLLIEADGSRQHPLKAPGEGEPPIPEFVDMVVVVAGLSALGKPLDENWVHRVERFRRVSESGSQQINELANRRGGESVSQQVITAEMITKALTHPEGGLKNIPARARRVALLNQADTAKLQAQAKSIAEKLLPEYNAIVVAALNPENGRRTMDGGKQPSVVGHRSSVFAVHEPVAGVILAAGESTRFGQPKQLLDWHGQPFVRAVTLTALAAGLSPVVVVTGASADEVETAVKDLPVQIAQNQDWQHGQSTSIRAGLSALPPPSLRDTSPKSFGFGGGREGVGAAIFLLADQPQVTPNLIRALVERHATDLPVIVAPLVAGQRANPVLFDRLTFPDLLALSGDVGGRAIFSKHRVTYLPWHDESLLLDVDTAEDYKRLESRE